METSVMKADEAAELLVLFFHIHGRKDGDSRGSSIL